MPYGMDTLNSTLSGAASGAVTGSVIPGIGTAIGAGIGGLVSLIGGLVASGDSPQEEMYAKIMELIQTSGLGDAALSKADIESLVKDLQTMYRGAASISAAKVGQAIGESGAAGGQGFADYYTTNIAPIIAQGEFGAAEAGKFGAELYSNNYNAAQNNLAQSLSLMTQGASGLSSMTGGQKGVAGFLQTLNLLANAGGNIAQGYAALNKKYPGVNSNGQIEYQ